MKQKKIFISGKITGNEIYYAQFLTAEIELKNKGHIVFNPATMPIGLEYEQYMHICKAMIDICDTVAFLPNWKDSKGAKIEMEYAKKANKKIMYLEV